MGTHGEDGIRTLPAPFLLRRYPGTQAIVVMAFVRPDKRIRLPCCPSGPSAGCIDGARPKRQPNSAPGSPIWQFRLFERGSLDYLDAGEESEGLLRVGLWDHNMEVEAGSLEAGQVVGLEA